MLHAGHAQTIGRHTLGRTVLLCACVLLLSTGASAAEDVVYAVTTGQSGRWPRIEKTEIFARDPQGGQPRLVFSDAGAGVLLVTAGQRVTAAAGGRVFALGVERRLYREGLSQFPAAVYELSPDGSNRAREIFDVEGENAATNFRDMFDSPSGAKIGHINSLGGKWYLILHDTATGRLLLRMDLSPIALDCFVRTIGWMPDGRRLFFTLETGDVHVTSDPSYARAGSYLMADDGGASVRVAPDVAMHPQRPGYQPLADMPPALLGWLPGGRYLFSDHQWRLAPAVPAPAKAHTFLYAVHATTKVRKDFFSSVSVTTGSFRLSPSGRMVAFTESQGESRAGLDLMETKSVRVLDLTTGKEQTLLSFSAKVLNLPTLELIGWLDGK